MVFLLLLGKCDNCQKKKKKKYTCSKKRQHMYTFSQMEHIFFLMVQKIQSNETYVYFDGNFFNQMGHISMVKNVPHGLA